MLQHTLPIFICFLLGVSASPVPQDEVPQPLTALDYILLTFFTVFLFYAIVRITWAVICCFVPEPSFNFDGWTEEETQSYDLARAFEAAHPPNSVPTDITPDQRQLIQEKGVYAWSFLSDMDQNVIINDRTEVTFLGGEVCVQTNLPIPKQQPIYYFEVKMFEKPESTKVGLGVATKPYPSWRFPGLNKTSIGYISNTGRKHFNDPFDGFDFGSTYSEGDVIGCGYRPRSGTIFFTKNGVKIGDAFSGLKCNLFPTIAAYGPCSLHVNLGQMGFVFIEANVGKWGLAPCEGSLLPPPAYGLDQDTILLEISPGPQSTPQTTVETIHKPPSYIGTPAPRLPSIVVSSPPPGYLEGSSERAPLLGDYESDE